MGMQKIGYGDVLREEIARRERQIVTLRAEIRKDAEENTGFPVAYGGHTTSLFNTISRLRDAENERELLADTLEQFTRTQEG